MSVLFADVVGFTARAERMDPEDVRRFLQPLHARLRSELERRGGTVEKFIGDAVMAVFGAPVVHEDDPERAVRAALAILEALAEDGDVEVRIGITTGEALIALETRPEAGEGIASGDVVNTASRLQARGAGRRDPGRRHHLQGVRASDRVRSRRAGAGQGQGRADPRLAGPAHQHCRWGGSVRAAPRWWVAARSCRCCEARSRACWPSASRSS